MSSSISVFWFRRDMRLHDNTGLFHALNSSNKILPIFIFDPEILDQLPKNDARVTFIYESLTTLNNQLYKNNKAIVILKGKPLVVFKELTAKYTINKVYANHDYESYAIQRDLEVQHFLNSKQIEFCSYKDQVFFEKNDIAKADGTPYYVYTPYKNKWKEAYRKLSITPFPSELHLNAICDAEISGDFPKLFLEDLGFIKSTIKVFPYNASPNLIAGYEDTRNYPSIINGTSKLGPHLRFGTVSIREILKKAIAQKNEVFWSELIWREFFMHILWHFPHTQTKAFKPKYEGIQWRNNELEFELWKQGKTGYPLVDAGMRELNETGYMHNRVRMVVASFLCKHLLIDWRWGEAYFAEKLLDYDMSANIGNWQWVAGTGVDAAPYFRIFNPTTQIQKFDNQQLYIKKWVTDLNELTYPTPMVDHKMARERCLKTYKESLL